MSYRKVQILKDMDSHKANYLNKIRSLCDYWQTTSQQIEQRKIKTYNLTDSLTSIHLLTEKPSVLEEVQQTILTLDSRLSGKLW